MNCTPLTNSKLRLKAFLIMKLIVFLMFCFSLGSMAHTLAQPVYLDVKDASIRTVAREIQRQTGFSLSLNERILSRARAITAQLNGTDVLDALPILFAGQPFDFRVDGRIISFVPKADASKSVKSTPIRLTAQQDLAEVSGRVVAENGVPLEKATVVVVHTQSARLTYTTQTDAEGYFRLRNIPTNSILVITYLGYRERRVPAAHDVGDIVLQPVTAELEEMVVVGYTAKSTNELTGSVQRLSGDELRQGVTTPNTLSMLKGRTTGLYITENSGESGARGQVIQRGQSSMTTPTNSYFGPLIVVDGVITNYKSLQDAVNPNDIADISILKDASSTAIYGSRSAQGVIVITTKRGRNGRTSADASFQYGGIQPVRYLRFMNTSELIDFMDTDMKRYWAQTPSLQEAFPDVNQFIRERRVYTDADRNRDFNWEDAIYSNGNFSNTEASFAHGTEKTRIYSGVAWYREDGVLYDNAFDRKSFRLNLDHDVSSNFQVNINISSLVDRTTRRNGIPELYMIQPFQYPYDDEGRPLDSLPVQQSSNYGPAYTTWTQNFLSEADFDNTSLTDVQNHLGSVRLRYNLFPGLSLQSTNSLNYMGTHVNSYLDPQSFSGKYGGFPYLFNGASPSLPNGTLDIQDTRFLDYLMSNLVDYRLSVGGHGFHALIGQEWGKRNTETMSMSLNTLLSGERNMGAAQRFGDIVSVAYDLPYRPSGNYQERATFSVFAQADYNYASRYHASVSLRTDATTNFGRDRRYGTFYSLSGGWVLSEEGFLRDHSAISNLKLRASYGTSGRDLGDGYLNTTFYADNRTYEEETHVGSAITQLANPAISWETMYATNMGLDIRLFDRIQLTADFYRKRSAGLLQNVRLTSAQGSLNQYQNVGEIINKGVELLITTHTVRSQDFNWHTSLNFSLNSNELSKLYQDSLLDNYSGMYYRKIGEDINVIKAIKFAGINAENGNMQHYNVDGNGNFVIVQGIGVPTNSENWQVVGSATPKFFGGFSNTFQYKNFHLNVDWWFQYGNYVMMSHIPNFQVAAAPRLGRNNVVFGSNQRVWKAPGDTEANYPDVFSTSPDAWAALTYRSSRVWGDASHARLRNVRFTYDLPQHVLTKLKLAKSSVYISGDNLWVIKHKEFVGSDPEGATLGSSSAYMGVGTGFANPRRFLVGIQLGF